MMESDKYKILAVPGRAELKEKGSRFIAFAFPLSDKDQAEEIIAQHAKQYYDATHNCFAYVAGADGSYSRFNDDGEPAGTAGKPILQAIESLELVNTLVIVTRYFGGTKLGTGGLIRAYGGAAASVLAATPTKICYLEHKLDITCSYHDLGDIMNCLNKFDGHVAQSNYAEDVHILVKMRRSRVESFCKAVVDKTAGRVKPALLDLDK